MSEIKHEEGIFYIGDNKDEAQAELTYTEVGPTQMIIDHTGVRDELRGQGIAGKLVRHAVEFAREENKKIIPLCPFTKDYIEANPELQDVLKK